MIPPPPGIGHNQCPDPGLHWRRHLWARAKAEAPEMRLAPHIIRRRVARAAELGMDYPTYATLYRTAGRDPAALLFTPEGLGLRLKRRLELPEALRAHLARLRACHLLALAPHGEPPAEFLKELCEVTALPFVAAGPSPAPHAPWPEKQAALRAALDPLRLPGAAVVLVGAAAPDLALCTAARLGGYLPHEAYFKQVA